MTKDSMQQEMLQEMFELPLPMPQTANRVLELEAVLTRSALAHEYALMGLEGKSFFHQQEILSQMEQHKAVYFHAREQLRRVNPHKLVQIEENLRLQKELVLRSCDTLH